MDARPVEQARSEMDKMKAEPAVSSIYLWEQSDLDKVIHSMVSNRSVMTMDMKTSSLLGGRLTSMDIPVEHPRVVRLYLCSASTDTKIERIEIMQKVYPRLREYCRYKYNVEFQLVDLAWGLSRKQLVSEPDLLDIKLQEILRCQVKSIGPNFLAIIGQNYGPRIALTNVLVEEFEAIRTALSTRHGRDTRQAPLLDECYAKDDNLLQPAYVRKDVSLILPDIDSEDPELRQSAEDQWAVMFRDLITVLQKGADLAFMASVIDSEVKEKFFTSELEKEVAAGVERSGNVCGSCVLVTRDIVDLVNYLDEEQAGDFAQLSGNSGENKALEPDALSRLLALTQRLAALPDKPQTFTYEVLWKFHSVIHPELHRKYLDGLCEDVYESLRGLVDKAAPSALEENEVAAVCEEPKRHWVYCRSVLDSYFHCQPELQLLQDYITDDTAWPLVLHGPQGCGKTFLLSKLAIELPNLVPENLLSVIRYVGLTAQSRNLAQMLHSICCQVSAVLGYAATDIPTDIKDLQRFFPELLIAIPNHNNIVIILDALDKMDMGYMGQQLYWLPALLPHNMKLIVSVEEGELLDQLKEHVLHYNTHACLLVRPLSLPDSHALLNHIMSDQGRLMSEKQMVVFTDHLLEYSLPMYIKLVAHQLRALTSFTDVTKITLPADCAAAIDQLFTRLEATHGQTLVSRAIAILVASESGVSELEMEDLLSLDNSVMAEVLTKYTPPICRLPCLIWIKLRRDLDLFLRETEVDGVTVLEFEHHWLSQAATARYLSDPPTSAAVYSLLAEYFLGTWADTPKPLQLGEGEEGLPPCVISTLRLVPRQPLAFPSVDDSAEPQFNLRMYNHVPRYLNLSGRAAELNELVLFNYEWLYNKLKALSLQDVLADLDLQPTPQVLLLKEALQRAAPVIEKDPNNLAAEITGRLLPYYHTQPLIRDLIKLCDSSGLQHCGLVPNFPYQQVPGSSLQFTLETPVVPDYLGLVFDGQFLLTKHTDDSEVYRFDMASGELKDTITTSTGQLHVTPNGQYFLLVDHVTEKAIKIHSAGQGTFLGQVILLNHLNTTGMRTDRYHAGPLSLTSDRLCAVVNIADTSILFICEVPSGNMLQILDLDGKATVCGMSPDASCVLCNSNQTLLMYDCCTMLPVWRLPLSCKPSLLAFTADCQQAFLAFPADTELLGLQLEGGTVVSTFSLQETGSVTPRLREVRQLTVSPDDQMLLLRFDRHLAIHRRQTPGYSVMFSRPSQVPSEFRLPKSYYQEMVFTCANFTRDSKCVIGTILRNIHIWTIDNSKLLTTIQAPIGVLNELLVSPQGDQLVSHVGGSRYIQVWHDFLGPRLRETVDKLTAPIHNVLLTQDCSLAYVQCQDSDEVGVYDMHTGALLDLLTHDTQVQDMAITPSGHMAMITTAPGLAHNACCLWDLKERRVLLEFGHTSGHCAHMHNTSAIVYLSQERAVYDQPYDLSVLHFTGSTYTVEEALAVIKYVRAKPVVTYDDRFIVVSAALDYDDSKGACVSPCVAVFDMCYNLKRTCYDAKSLGLERELVDIVQVEPCRQEENCVALVVTCRPAPPEPEPDLPSPPRSELSRHRGSVSSRTPSSDQSRPKNSHLSYTPSDMSRPERNKPPSMHSSRHPSAQTNGLSNGSRQHSAQSTGLVNGNHQPGPQTDELASRSQHPSAQSNGPGNRNHQPSIKSNDGFNKDHRPSINSNGLVNGKRQSITQSNGLLNGQPHPSAETNGLVNGHQEGEGEDTEAAGDPGEGVAEVTGEESEVEVSVSHSTCAERDLHVGFLVLDVKMGCIVSVVFLKPGPDLPFPPRLVFNNDVSLCMDEASNMYNLAQNTALSGHVQMLDTAPQCLALEGLVAVYYSGSQLYALRSMDGSLVGRVEVHAPICHVTLCPDQRTLLVGCTDGTLASYVIVDSQLDQDPAAIVDAIKTRHPPPEDKLEGRLTRTWDKVGRAGAPPYSRPPSAVSSGTNDKQILLNIQPAEGLRPNVLKPTVLKPAECLCVVENPEGIWQRVWKRPLRGKLLKVSVFAKDYLH